MEKVVRDTMLNSQIITNLWQIYFFQLTHITSMTEILGVYVCVCVKVIQSCPILCDPLVCNFPGSSDHEILQAKYWSGLPFPSPGALPNPWIKPRSPALHADSLPSESPGSSMDILKKFKQNLSLGFSENTKNTSCQYFPTK